MKRWHFSDKYLGLFLQVAKLSQRDRATLCVIECFASHSRSYEMTLLSRACICPYWYFIETMSVCRAVY